MAINQNAVPAHLQSVAYAIDALIPDGTPRWNDNLGTPITLEYSFMDGVPLY